MNASRAQHSPIAMPETGDVLSILHKVYGWGSIWDGKTPELENKVEPREANKKYDADTRKRGFVESWREGPEWLEFSETEEKNMNTL